MPSPVDFQALFQHSPNSYMVLDRQLRFVAANEAYLQVTGKRHEELIGQNLFDEFPHDPADPGNESATLLRQSLERVLATGRPDVIAFIRYRVPRPGDGGHVEDRFWSATHTPIHDEHGEVAYILQHTVDVTELQRLRDAASHPATTPAGDTTQIEAGVLERAREVQETNQSLQTEITQQKIQEAERAALFERERAARAEAEAVRDELHRRAEFDKQLVGIVSHDLRNPMNAIGIATHLLLKRGQLDEQSVGIVNRIMSSSDRAVRLIKDFLDFTQARVMGRIPVSPKPASIRDIARQVFEEVLMTQPSRRGTFVHEGEEHGTWDPDRLAQVIGNLLSNAFQHSPPSSVVRLVTRGDQDGVTIDVHNEGTPISPDDRARLFEPFERGGDASASGRSIGLGLYISRQIVEAHAGRIEVRSVEGEGTRFTVWLPRRASADGEALGSSSQFPVPDAGGSGPLDGPFI
jgi:PAS domain S-box-containing protein